MKRLFSAFLATLMLVSLLPSAAFAALEPEVEPAAGAAIEDALPQEPVQEAPVEETPVEEAPVEEPPQEPLVLAFTGADALDAEGTARYVLTADGESISLTVTAESGGELSYVWQLLNAASGEYEDIDPLLNPSALTCTLTIAAAGAITGLDAAYRCVVTAALGGETITGYALFTLNAPAEQPAGEPAAEPAGEPAAEPAGEPAAEPIGEPAAEPAEGPAAELPGADGEGDNALTAASYTVSYNANGGKGAPAAQTKLAGEPLTLSDTAPTRAGYQFLGWGFSASAKADENTLQPGDLYDQDRSRTLYAIWQIEIYTISYDANGGDGAPEPQLKSYGAALTLSSIKPVQDGFYFLGWALDDAAEEPAYKPGAAFNKNQDTVLYAVWVDLSSYAAVISTVVAEGEYTACAGRPLKLKAALEPSNISGTRIEWELAEGDELYATLTPSSDGKTATLTARAVSEVNTVTVTAKSKDSLAAPDTREVSILPAALAVSIFAAGEEVTGDTVVMDLNQSDDPEAPVQLALEASVAPDGAGQNVKWSSGSTAVATVDKDGVVTAKAVGTAVITCTSDDGGKKSASVKVEVKRIPAALVKYGAWPSAMVGGKSVTLQVKGGGKLLTGGAVIWSINNGTAASAEIGEKTGVLKTKPVAVPTAIEVLATLRDAPSVTLSQEIVLYPAATGVQMLYGGAIVTGKTVAIDKGRGVAVLAARVLPAGAYENISWKSSNTAIATVEDGLVTPLANGTVTITATATAPDNTKRYATVKLNISTLAERLTIEDAPASLSYGDPGKQLKAVFSNKPTSKLVAWTVSDPTAATVSSTGKLTAKLVYEEKTVVITATARDGGGAVDFVTVIIKPKLNQLRLLSGELDVTKKTLYLDVGDTLSLTQSRYGAEPLTDVAWTSSSPAIASVEDGTVTAEKAGTAVIKATSGGYTSTVTVKVTQLATDVEVLVVAPATAPVVSSGKSLRLNAKVTLSGGSSKTGVKTVLWSVDDPTVATVNSSGVLTAAYTETAKDVVVTATAADGSGITGELTVAVTPATVGIYIISDEQNVSNTVQTCAINSTETISLSAVCFPEGAYDTVKWSSGSKTVAEFKGDDGTLTINKTGTTTIKAAALDGSGKSTSFRLTVVRLMEEIEGMPETAIIAGGRSLTLKPVVAKEVTNKKLKWTLSGEDTVFARISSSGVLSTKPVTDVKTVTVTAESTDGSDVSVSCNVSIYPAPTAVKIFSGDTNVTGKTMLLGRGDTLELTGAISPGKAYDGCTWKSSSNYLATVSPEGVVTANEYGRRGTVTITCAAADGSGKSAVVKIKITA